MGAILKNFLRDFGRSMAAMCLVGTALLSGTAGLVAYERWQHPSIIGKARVIDGDTLQVDGIRIRLNGIDAPELRDPLGPASRRELKLIVGDDTIRCRPNGDTTHGRIVAVCMREDGRDIGAELIRHGLALDCQHFSDGRYHDFETEQARRRIKRASYCRTPGVTDPDYTLEEQAADAAADAARDAAQKP